MALQSQYNNSTFTYDGVKYTFSIIITSYNKRNNIEDVDALDNNFVQKFEYVNTINNLCLEGSIEYIDNYGIIEKLIERPLVFVEVQFIQMTTKSDNEIVIENYDKKEYFRHKFFITSLKILDRKAKSITYKLNLMSANWFNCIKNIDFSNLHIKNDKNINNKDIIYIIQSMLRQRELNTDINGSFKNIRSGVLLDYVSNGNDTAFSSINYLLDKMFYYQTKDSSIKFLVYDETNDMYKIISLDKEDSFLGNRLIQLSFFNSNIEGMSNSEGANLNTVTKFPRQQHFINDFNKTMFDYDFNTNSFLNRDLSKKQILNYKNTTVDSKSYQQKFDYFDHEKLFQRGSYWNNDYCIYNNIVKTLIEDTSLVMNTGGMINLKPGYTVSLTIDRDIKYARDDSPEAIKEIMEKYQSFDGLWIVIKTRHMICPGKVTSDENNSSDEESESNAYYKQNIVMMRNFIRTPMSR